MLPMSRRGELQAPGRYSWKQQPVGHPVMVGSKVDDWLRWMHLTSWPTVISCRPEEVHTVAECAAFHQRALERYATLHIDRAQGDCLLMGSQADISWY